ncbi:MAG: tetratricopeptide repeat protein [Alphaproteobacteria bacterium]
MTTIGLCVIAKDESRVILRCLENVRPLVDYALVVDTGSTDGTQAIVKEFLSKTKLPGEVVEEPWRDFAYNRSFALAKLRERRDIDYALVMDADDILVFADGFDASKFRETLDRDYYSIENRAGGVRFWRAHILSNKVDFIYKGVLHEFVARPRAAFSAGVVSGLHVQAGTEGARSRNPDKHRDDARTLEKALETETDEFIRARYTFYLAQSWMRAGEKEKALHIFLRRAELGFFDQEVYLALYHAAELKEALGYPDSEVIASYFKAYEADPRRAEALYGAMRYCRLTDKPHQAYLIGKHALTIAEPFGQLFVVSWTYDFGLLEEFAEAAYRSGHYQDSLEALEKILADGKIPESERPRIRDNARRAEEKLTARPSGRPRAAAETECQLMPVVPAQAFQAAASSHREGRLAEAEQLYRAILEADHDHIDSLHNLGAVCLQQGKHVEAVKLLRETLRLKPDHVDAHNNLGAALRDLGRFEEAEAFLRGALRLKPDHPEAHHNLGVTLKDLGGLTEAEASIREALRLKPVYPKALNSLGAVHGDQGRPAEAEACYREALRLDPDYAEPHHNLGNALRDLGRLPEAENSYRKALSLKPDDPGWRSNLGMLLLLAGRLEEGWHEYEWRRSTKQWPARFTQPLWEGEAIGERVLLLYAEQGFGDTIQFCRYAPLIPSKARVILEVPRPIVRLLSSLEGVDQIVVEGDPLPPFDLHCPLLSLPRAFGTTLETIPAKVPYLAADAASVSAWRRRLEELPGLRVGLVWAGSARKSRPGANAIDRRRSITLDDFGGLASVPGVSFVSLQKGEPASQTRSPPPGLAIHDWTEELGDFADTAALVEALDLVITVDTAAVHLAGALAKPVWLLNRFDTCWRWLLGRDDSPWYPTLRQFRQLEPGDWGSVLSEVRAALAALAASEAHRQEDRVELDPERSRFKFRLRRTLR